MTAAKQTRRRTSDHKDDAPESTRNRILAAAAKTLALKGYSESRLADIAAAAGLRPPAVYYYFDSRDDLIAEALRVGQVRVRKHVELRLAALPQDASALDKIAAGVDAHLRVQLELSDFASAVTRNAGHVPPAVRLALQEESDAYHDLWRTLLLEAQRNGELRPGLDPGIARMLVVGALNWSTEWWTNKQSSIEDLITNAQLIVRSGLAS